MTLKISKQIIFVTSLCFAILETTTSAGQFRIYIGTYTDGESKGIYVAEFDSHTGLVGEAKLAAEATNPSFLAVHPNNRYLYAVSEVGDFQNGTNTGGILAYKIDSANGTLKQLNGVKSNGGAPCHLVIDKSGKHILTANYMGGNCNVVEIQANGRLGRQTSVQQHTGSSITPRQKEPHAHSINLDRQNRFAFVADLGIDKMVTYRFEKGRLTPQEDLFVSLDPGAGPRHFSFHPTYQYAYVINELNSTITAMKYDEAVGRLTTVQSVSTLPADYAGRSNTAEVVVHPSGKFVFGSNRGHDSIAVFKIEMSTGKLTLVEIEKTQGRTPRNFAVDPTGRFLLAENQSSNTIVVFSIDADTGELNPTEYRIDVPSPVCVKFLKL